MKFEWQGLALSVAIATGATSLGGFADTDNAGVVYFTDNDSEYIDYDNPISHSAYTAISDEYFAGANEITVTFYEISAKGIEEYLLQ